MSDEEGTYEKMSAIASLLSAGGTLFIALIIQLATMYSRRASELDRRRSLLKQAADEVDVKAAISLFLNHRVTKDDGSSEYLSGGTWNEAWNPNMDYVGNAPLLGRLVLTDFLDSYRASAHIFSQYVTGQSETEKIWTGVYDVITKDLRLSTKPFRQYYLSSVDGIQANRQTYVQSVVGNKADWTKIVDVMCIFDPELDKDDMPWLASSNIETNVSVKVNEEED